MSYIIYDFLLSILKGNHSPYIKVNMTLNSNEEIISRLKFISRINGGEKINVRYMFVQQDDILTKISRTAYYKDNRRNAIAFVRGTIDRSFEIINLYRNSEKEAEKVLANHIINDLKQAKRGLVNLKETYLTDVKFCCDMDTILQEIDAKLSELEINMKQTSE